MKEVNFKLIELPTHQVLLMKHFDNENVDICLVVITFFIEGIKLDMKIGYDSEQNRNKMFDEFGEINAQKMVDKMIAQMGG
jgi:hypothetical protein